MALHFPQNNQMSSHSKPKTIDFDNGSTGGSVRKSRRRLGTTFVVVLAFVLVIVLTMGGVCGVLLYRSANEVKARAQEIMSQVDPLKESLKSGSPEGLESSVRIIREDIEFVDEEVNSLLWNLASNIPVLGEDITIVQTLGDACSTLVNDALVPITTSVSGIGTSELLQDGVINIGLIQNLSNAISSSLPAIEESVSAISALPKAHIPQLANILDRIQGPVSEIQGLIDELKPVLDLLPQMLGADGQTRTYLIVAQNNSEVRSTGGLPGSWGTICITDGAISMGEFTTVVNHPGFDVPVLDEELNYLGWTLGTNAAQMTYTPNFVRTGELASEYWSQAGFGEVDGVISVDPVFLQRLLGLTGGFTAPDGAVVDGSNAAKVLLSNTYWKFGNDGDAQDAYFGSIAALAFENVMGNLGNASMTDFLDVLEKSAEDCRLLVWMANEEEENLMRALGVSGEPSFDPTQPELGVYLNDATWSKIDWYISCYTTIGEGVVNADGSISYAVTTYLSNTITPEEAASAPAYVKGVNPEKRDDSDMLTYVYFFAPAGGTISEISFEGSGTSDGFISATAYGLEMRYGLTSLLAGESLTFSYTVTTSAEADNALSLRTSPLAQERLMQAPE